MPYFDFTSFEDSFNHYIKYVLGKEQAETTRLDLLNAVSAAVNKYLIDISFDTRERYRRNGAKRLYYLSMEFLVGRMLSNNLINLGIYDACERFLKKMGYDLAELTEQECDPALGNGGLGRLAACFLDSMASLDMPGFGYGINYDYGLFHQVIVDGYQREKPDYWPNRSSPWLIRRSGEQYMLPIYGRVEDTMDRNGDYNPMWTDWKLFIGRPHDILVAGYGGRTVNRLRLFSAWASEEFDIHIFNDGDYHKAVRRKIQSETVTKILYPSDSKDTGKELRLVQEYFLVACAVRDIIWAYERGHRAFDLFHEKVAIQLNDTHPALTVAELMRILVDEKGLQWDTAWKITVNTLGYTNHTLLPEALETWPVSIMKRVIPRHLQIIFEINRRFIESVKSKYGDSSSDMIHRMSIIRDGHEPQVLMANLAIVGSHSVNGVAKVHSDLVKTRLVPEFYSMWPEKFNNKTNGVTPRRWLAACNPGLAGLITETIGDRWLADFSLIWELEAFQGDPGFLDRFRAVKQRNKERLAEYIRQKVSIKVDPSSIFDIHAKRIHEYKRQLLNVLHIIHLYLSVKEAGADIGPPRTFIFAGKAAPGYHIAKLIIKLIHNVAETVNNDPAVNQALKVVFLPDYRVTLAERMIPAADVSEQISTAGTEASGTGNMKFAMNGALTIGTLDGANIEISEQVGENNIYIFGLTVPQVADLRRDGYRPKEYLERDSRLKQIVYAMLSNRFSPGEHGLFRPIYNSLAAHGDYYLHLADFDSYAAAHQQIAADFSQPDRWAAKALKNTARTGMFSSDRTIKEYAADIWDIRPQP